MHWRLRARLLNQFVFIDTTQGEVPDPVAVAEPGALAALAGGLAGMLVFVRRPRRERSLLAA